MSKGVSAVEYIAEDPCEAKRLEAKVDSLCVGAKYLAHRVVRGCGRLFWWAAGQE